jgi:hypothetical protein
LAEGDRFLDDQGSVIGSLSILKRETICILKETLRTVLGRKHWVPGKGARRYGQGQYILKKTLGVRKVTLDKQVNTYAGNPRSLPLP